MAPSKKENLTMNTDDKLIIGLPAGSLADPSRGGNLVRLLKHAGFPTKGYESGGPSSFPITPFLMGWDGRPQDFGAQLAIGELDVAIAGEDWMQERTLELKHEYDETITPERVLGLNRGKVRLVIIDDAFKPEDGKDAWMTKMLSQKPLVSMVSEMPYLGLDWFQRNAERLGFGDSHRAYSVQRYKTPPKIDSGLVIYDTWGKTEAKIKLGGVDFGLEITQTGTALRNYGLEIVDEVMQSESSVWINPAIKNHPTKYELAKMFVLNLYGSVFAEDKVIILFNVRNENEDRVVAYLDENNLFADEPTINRGPQYTEFNIQVDVSSAKLPLARVRYELAQLGASGIDTIPLDSSIPGIHALDF